MGFRYRKSIQIVPGVRMNISKSGVGYSAGGKGYRVTKHANGRVSRTVSVPGTGLSHNKTLSSGRRSPTPATQPVPPPPRPPKPGMLSPGNEKALFGALEATTDRSTGDFASVARNFGSGDPALRVLCASLEGLWHFARLDGNAAGDPSRARALLGWAAANDPTAAAQHPLAIKYLRDAAWPVEIAHGIVAHLPLHLDVVRLAAAELHQAASDLDAAIWCVEHAEPTASAALSLAELYSEAQRHSDVIDVTTGVENADDATALLLVLRGRAFSASGYHDAARAALKDALRVRSRAAAVRHRALLERAQVNLSQNRKAAARKDVESVLADDPSYPGLAELLTSLP